VLVSVDGEHFLFICAPLSGRGNFEGVGFVWTEMKEHASPLISRIGVQGGRACRQIVKLTLRLFRC